MVEARAGRRGGVVDARPADAAAETLELTPALTSEAHLVVLSHVSPFSNQLLVSLGPLSQKLLSSHRRVWSGPHRQVAPSVIIEREQQIQEKIQEQTASGEQFPR